MTVRDLPKIDKFLNLDIFRGDSSTLLLQIAQEKIAQLRKALLDGSVQNFDIDSLAFDVKQTYINATSPSLHPLINATGVILHTNMGRSLIAKEVLEEASKVICNYSNLEYNQEEGKRGERYEHVSKLLKTLLGVEDILVVNNNASAVFLILNTFAKEKEVIVSRGELVEIGGSFRIPDVMAQSGAKLVEIGTTNKTKKSDYENAITQETSMLLKVHKSNFDIVGFSDEVAFSDIKHLAQKHNLLDYYDLGSGYIPELPYNLSLKEPSIGTLLKSDPSLISFSGDKLFGSVQAGIIAGKKELILKLKKNQLLRMLRVDKLTLSILEQSVKAYLENDLCKIPTLLLLFTSVEDLEKRAKHIKNSLAKGCAEVIHTTTFMGGGTLPNREFPSVALHIKGKAVELEKKFRKLKLIGRIEDDKFLIDFRSILPSLDTQIQTTIQEVLS